MGLIKLVRLPIVISIVFLAVNILTASRSPTIWQDEVMFLDPAANLASGKGFRTTFWSFQDTQKTFTANVPLYPLILAGWVGLGAIEPGWVRSLNFFLALGMVWMLGEILKAFVAQNKKIDSRLGLFYFLTLGWGSISFSYRSGRYDILCGLLLTITIYGVSRKSRVGAWAASVAAFLSPWAGLQTVIVLGLGILVAFALWKTDALKPILVVSISAGMGLAFLLFWMWFSDGLETFLKSIRFLGGARPASIMKLITGTVRWDFIALLTICGICWLGRNQHLKTSQKWALFMGILTPTVFGLLGKYPVYYSLFSIFPLLFFFCSLEKSRLLAFSSWILILLTCFTGLPARWALLVTEWRERSPEILKIGITRFVSSGGHVLVDYPFYYSVKNTEAMVYGPQLIWENLPGEIDMIVASPDGDLDQFAKSRKWILVNERKVGTRPMGVLGAAKLYAWRIYQKPKVSDRF